MAEKKSQDKYRHHFSKEQLEQHRKNSRRQAKEFVKTLNETVRSSPEPGPLLPQPNQK